MLHDDELDWLRRRMSPPWYATLIDVLTLAIVVAVAWAAVSLLSQQ